MKALIQSMKEYVTGLARENDFEWFFNMHQPEILACAEELLGYYPKADKTIVRLACWLHDIRHYMAKGADEILRVKDNHHIAGAVTARGLLAGKISGDTIDAVCRCIERHRNMPGFEPQSIEEKIVACADARSHFVSVFYLTYFKLHPDHTLEQMVEKDTSKLERDIRDASILPDGLGPYVMSHAALVNLFSGYIGSRQ